jgi:hypothetical protein
MGVRSKLLETLGRAAILLVWALAAWGALLVVSAAANAVGEGPGPAIARLLPDGDGSFWAWLGFVAVLLALASAILAAVIVVARRRQGTATPGK